jgi:hypothetical protein
MYKGMKLARGARQRENKILFEVVTPGRLGVRGKKEGATHFYYKRKSCKISKKHFFSSDSSSKGIGENTVM